MKKSQIVAASYPSQSRSENPSLAMKVFMAAKGRKKRVACLEADEAHSQFVKLKGLQPESRSKFRELFDKKLRGQTD